MAVDQNAQKTLFDALYCDDDGEEQSKDDDPVLLHEHDFSWDVEELESLFSKERETRLTLGEKSSLHLHSPARKEAVEWILKITSHYGFSALCAILAADYLDRFVSSFSFQPEKPWMMQLVAVSCLSLAAKVEEVYVPLLVDLQVEVAKYVFEAKAVQRMELLVLSTLKWRMNPLTPLSFVDHVVRRQLVVGLRSHAPPPLEFLGSCGNLLLSVLSDSRFVLYPPSVMATATMLHVIRQALEPHQAMGHEEQLLGLLKVGKEEVDHCCRFISDKVSNTRKRTLCQVMINSPCGVTDSCFSSEEDDDTSNDSWELIDSPSSSSSSPQFKKRRVREFSCRLFADNNAAAMTSNSSPH